jgi:cell division protein FtsW (lipid II flippase)
MVMPKKPSGTASGRAWPQWIVWTIAAIALLLLVLEHRAHALGWWLHVLLGLCVVLLYLLVRFGGDGAGRNGPR